MWKHFDKQVVIEIGIRVGVILVIVVITVLLAKLVRSLMGRKKHFVIVDNTQFKFLSHLFTGIIYVIGFIAVIYSIPALRGLSNSMLAGSGVLAIIIGFASQHAFANIVGGIFIAVFKPFRIGDRLRFVGKEFIGIVEDITLRHTVIRTFDNKRIIVPNSVVSSEILENSNIVDPKILKFWEIGISYDSDVDRAMNIIREEALNHPNSLDTRTEEEIAGGLEQVKVRVLAYEESAVRLRANIWATDSVAAFNMECDLNYSIKKRFDAEGIEIPFPHRTLVYKK